VKILVAGAKGLVGSGISSTLEQHGFNVIRLSRNEVDLEDKKATLEYLSDLKPRVVVDAAARVGGVLANNTFPVDFLMQNLQIQMNLMNAAYLAKVSRFVFLGSSCIYPRSSPQPIQEVELMAGPLESTNSAYSIAKIAGIELIKAYRKQFNLEWISLIPTSLYGPNDNFSVADGHVIPSMIRKFITARESGLESVTLWGDGSPLREFLYISDLAEALICCLSNYDSMMPLNIGSGQEISIKSLADKIVELVGYEGKLIWDKNKPNGTPRKLLDSSRIKKLGWAPRVRLEEGLVQTIDWYRANLELGSVRL
jgi:GDP-L-fucose synthase